MRTKLIIQNVNILVYSLLVYQLLNQNKSTVCSEKGIPLVGQLNCVRGWQSKSRGLVI